MKVMTDRFRWSTIHRFLILAAAAISLIVIAAACGDDDDGDDVPSETTPAAATQTDGAGDATPTEEPDAELEKPTLRLGTLGGGEYFLNLYISQEEGFYEQFGFESVEITEFQASPDLAAALLSGAIDVGVAGYSGVLLAYGAGEDVKAFYAQSECACYQLISSSEYATLDDALDAGATMGVSAVGGLDWAVGRLLITRAGGDPDQLDYVAAGNPTQRTEALLAGNIDMLAAVPPGAYKLADEGQNVLIDMVDVLPSFPFEVAWAKTSFLEENPNTTYALVQALGAAGEWARENEDAAVDMGYDQYRPAPENEEYFERTFRDLLIHDWPSADSEIDLEGARGLAEFYIESGSVEGTVDEVIENTWDLSFTGDRQP